MKGGYIKVCLINLYDQMFALSKMKGWIKHSYFCYNKDFFTFLAQKGNFNHQKQLVLAIIQIYIF